MASKVFKLVGSMVLRMFRVPPEPPVAVSPSSAALESPESLAVLLVPALELVPEVSPQAVKVAHSRASAITMARIFLSFIQNSPSDFQSIKICEPLAASNRVTIDSHCCNDTPY